MGIGSDWTGLVKDRSDGGFLLRGRCRRRRTNRMEKLYRPPISTTLFQTLTGSARESDHANTEICGAPAHRSARARECARVRARNKKPTPAPALSRHSLSLAAVITNIAESNSWYSQPVTMIVLGNWA
jgi:hypothetical protein